MRPHHELPFGVEPVSGGVRSRLWAPRGRCRVLGPVALRVEWRLGDGSRLLLLANFAEVPVPLSEPVVSGGPDGLLYCSAAIPPPADLAPCCAAFYLGPAGTEAR